MTPYGTFGASAAGEWVALLADGGVQVALLTASALLVERALRRTSAALRHGVLAGALLASPCVVALGAALREPAWFAGLAPAGAAALCAAWALGVGVVLAPLLRGLLGLRSVAAAGEEAGAVDGVAVRHADVRVPLTFGWRRPVVLLPREAKGWSPAERRSVLAHELAHVRRGDWALQVAARGIAALFWFVPSVWMLRSRLRLLAEHAADDAVLAGGVRPSDYAGHLLARVCRVTTTPGVPMAPRPHQVDRRVRAILAPGRRAGPTRWAAAAGLLTALAGLPLAGAGVVEAPPPACAPNPDPLVSATEDLLNRSMLEQDALASAAQVVARDCPHRRSGLQILVVLSLELERLIAAEAAAGTNDPQSAVLLGELVGVRDAVKRHRTWLGQLGVAEVPALEVGDWLGLYAPWTVAMEAKDLERLDDPVRPLLQSLESVMDLVVAMDQETTLRLDRAGVELGDANNLLLPELFPRYRSWLLEIDERATALRLAAARGTDGAPSPEAAAWVTRVEERVLRLLELLEAYDGLGC